MAFVRAKRQGSRTYYQLVESRREGTKVKQKVIVHLGPYPSVEEAVAGYSDRAARAREQERLWLARAEAERIAIEKLRERVRPDLVGTGIPRPEGRTRSRYWRWRDLAEGRERWAAKLESIANQIRQRSAQKLLTAAPFVGTTEEAQSWA